MVGARKVMKCMGATNIYHVMTAVSCLHRIHVIVDGSEIEKEVTVYGENSHAEPEGLENMRGSSALY